MHFSILATSVLTFSLAFSMPTFHGQRRHEKRREGTPLSIKSRAPQQQTLPVRISLTQRNLHLGHDLLMERSDPKSDKYGQHMSAQEVGELFRPSKKSVNTVRQWLHSSGIDAGRHGISAGRSWLNFEATVEELESLLSTQYHVYEHSMTQEEHIGCEEYYIPDTVHPHIDFITPSVSTIKVNKRAKRNGKRDVMKSSSTAALNLSIKPATGISHSGLGDTNTTSSCYTLVTPECLRSLYGIPMGNSSLEGNKIGIFEDGDFYDTTDIDLTFAAIAPYIPNGTYPILEGIDGGTAPMEGFIGAESILDISVILPLIYPQEAILFQVDDYYEVLVSQGFGNTFLDALDASYCTYDGGDVLAIDPDYPDTVDPIDWLPAPTWNNTEMCGAYTPTNVISVSYGAAEYAREYSYWNRQCTEFMKLGLQGVTLVYASGDAGVSGTGNCIAPDDEDYDADTSDGAFSPLYPASCPYVTAVGATQFNSDGTTETAVADPDADYWSGGGFSNLWPAPSYQEAALATYFADYPPPYDNLTVYGTPYYNKTGRGYPDVAAIGADIFLYLESQEALVGGTSASAPIFASIINLINEQRLAAGKTTVGFVNPTLYENPDAFTDITTGSNPGCSTQGFSAVKGWDPVTGLGTPIFDKLLTVFMALP